MSLDGNFSLLLGPGHIEHLLSTSETIADFVKQGRKRKGEVFPENLEDISSVLLFVFIKNFGKKAWGNCYHFFVLTLKSSCICYISNTKLPCKSLRTSRTEPSRRWFAVVTSHTVNSQVFIQVLVSLYSIKAPT